MLYLFLNKNRIKILYVKKTLLGQYENAFYNKTHTVDLLDDKGEAINIDLLASAIKEATSSLTDSAAKDKEVCLILTQHAFHFFRAEVPADIAPSAVSSFVKDKARSLIQKDAEQYNYDFLIQDNENQKQILFFGIEKDTLQHLQETLNLVDLHLVSVIPESLAYFKLFQKTLRKDKRENILYAIYEQNELRGYLYDSFGPMQEEAWSEPIPDGTMVEEVLRNKIVQYGSAGLKLNRIILSGDSSEDVRQDTFTKNVGVWTNPLKRIIPHFYQDYLKIFVIPADKTLPLLLFDACIGTLIFHIEDKSFSLLKKRMGFSTPSFSKPSFSVPKKEVAIFITSFVLSFLTFIGISKLSNGNILPKNVNLLIAAKPTPTPTPVPPTPTPTPTLNRKDVYVKILNGSGVKGKASEVKDLLKEKGYEQILTGNADNFDYAVTEIQVKKGKENLANTMKNDIKESVSDPKMTELTDEDTKSDVVLIFGADFK